MNFNDDELISPIEFYIDQKNFEGSKFPLDFFRKDGGYIPVYESYREPIMCSLADGEIKPTGNIVMRLNMTPNEAAALNLYIPTPCDPITNALDLITRNPDYLGATPHMLSMEMLSKYGIRRYKGSFYIFNNSYYEYVSEEMMKQIVHSTFIEYVERVGNSKFSDDVVSELKRNPDIVVTESSICRNAVAFRNGCFDLRYRMLVPPSKEIVTFFSIDANLRPDVFYNAAVRANCTPVFDDFLMSISGGDLSLINRIWEMIGYVITPDNFGRAFFVLQGVPASGKSTIERLLMRMFSRGSVFKVNGEELGAKFAFQGLENKAVIIISDMPDKNISGAGASAIKKITGRDGISTDVKHRERTQFETTAKIVCFTNYAFYSDSFDQALYDRAVTVPFRYSVPRQEQDIFLDEKLAQEIDFIATKALCYYICLLENHYRFSGHYPLNECIQAGAMPDPVFRTQVYSYVRDHFLADPVSAVLTLDAHAAFCNYYGRQVDITKFSEYLRSAAEEMFGAKKAKIRVNPGENPRNVILGVRMK